MLPYRFNGKITKISKYKVKKFQLRKIIRESIRELLMETYTGCDLDTNSLYLEGNNVLYNSSSPIAGFQFSINGGLTGASGGDAAGAGFLMSAYGNTVLGFSFTGGTIPAGCGTLCQLSGAYIGVGGVPINSINIADASGMSVPFTYWIPSSPPSSCDNTPAGACAQQWFGYRANAMANFMGNKECTGSHTFDGAYNRFYSKSSTIASNWYSLVFGLLGYFPENEAMDVMNATNYQQIHDSVTTFANLAGIPGGGKDKLRRVTAKYKWADCMKQECSC
jgi:hypothetical protein